MGQCISKRSPLVDILEQYTPTPPIVPKRQPECPLTSLPELLLSELLGLLPRHALCLVCAACTQFYSASRAVERYAWMEHHDHPPAWRAYAASWHGIGAAERTKLLWSGIPSAWRPRMWLLLTDALMVKDSLDAGGREVLGGSRRAVATWLYPEVYTDTVPSEAVALVAGRSYYESLQMQEVPFYSTA